MHNSFNPLDHPILFAAPRRLTPYSTWRQHIPIGLLLIDLLKPEVLVELGTYYGDSYCAFCQAVQELGLGTRCFAIDTWQGDEQSGFYGPEVLPDLRAHHDPLYGSFSELITGTFDEALSHFSDATIDLLHIDGYHTYDATKHNFECWFPKLSPRGIVLFHDIHVHKGDFGAWRFWDELKARYAHAEFRHGRGLGVLAVGKELAPALSEFLLVSTEQATSINDLLFDLGYRLEAQVQVAEHMVERERTVQTLNAQRLENEQALQTLSARLAEKERAMQQQLAEKDGAISSLRQTVAEQTEHLDALGARIEFLSRREAELRVLLLDAHEQLVQRDEQIQILRKEAERCDRETAPRDKEIGTLRAQVASRDKEIEVLRRQMASCERKIQNLRAQIQPRDEEITNLRAKSAWLDGRINRMKATKIWQLGNVYWRVHSRLRGPESGKR